MKYIYRIVAVFTFLLALAVFASGQTDPKPNPTYDAELAKRLGGDKMGMRKYVLALLKTGPNDATITDKEKRAELFKVSFLWPGLSMTKKKSSAAFTYST
jgi:uncharacterized protein